MTGNGEGFILGVWRIYDIGKANAALVEDIFRAAGLLDDSEWDNVPLHCLRVAQVCEEIGIQIILNDLSVEEYRLAIMAGLLHDVRKNIERQRADELVSQQGMSKGEAFGQAKAEQSNWLLGLWPELAEVVRVSALSGHTSLAYFLAEPRPLAEQIFHAADDLCGGKRGNEVVMLADRMAALAVRYPWLATEHPAELGGMSWADAQFQVSAAILNNLVGFMKDVEYADGEALNRALVEAFRDKV